MPIAQRAAPTGGANLLASRTLGAIPQLNQQRIGLTMTRLADLVNERNELLGNLSRLREEKAAEGTARDQERAALGGVIGGGVALAAAPFTGGASLALLPAATSVGTGIGQLTSGDPAGAATISQAVVPNSFAEFFKNKTGAPAGGAGLDFDFGKSNLGE